MLFTRATEDAGRRGLAPSVFAEQAADGFDRFVDHVPDDRFGAGGAVDDAFGDFGDAAFLQGTAEHFFVDAADRVVDGFGQFAGGRGGGRAA